MSLSVARSGLCYNLRQDQSSWSNRYGTNSLAHAASLYGLETGRPCRACGAPIAQQDAFGTSEGVCHRCRERADANANA